MPGDTASDDLENGDIAGTIDKLMSLLAKIDAQDGKKLTEEEAAILREALQAMLDAIVVT